MKQNLLSPQKISDIAKKIAIFSDFREPLNIQSK